MQWLKLVTEDAGVQRLKAGNRLPATTPGIDPVPPYPATHSARIGERREASARPVEERRQNERRKGGERRQKQVPVVLDTRSKHERRALENRRGAKKRSRDQSPPRPRINVYV